jgi:hypothetical protein
MKLSNRSAFGIWASEKQEITGELFAKTHSGYGFSNHLKGELILAGRIL